MKKKNVFIIYKWELSFNAANRAERKTALYLYFSAICSIKVEKTELLSAERL